MARPYSGCRQLNRLPCIDDASRRHANRQLETVRFIAHSLFTRAKIFPRNPHYQGIRPFDIGRKIRAQIMQRLFSVFPNSLPGAGLLLLRLCDGLLLLVHSAILSGFKMSLEGLAQLVAAGAGSLILVGLATPIAAAVGGVTVLCIAAPIETHIVLATIGASLALLGPGAWSIDARLYGRRRIDLDSL